MEKISLGLIFSVIAAGSTLIGALIVYVYNKCKIGWTESDEKLSHAFETRVNMIDEKISSRTIELHKRIDKEKDISDKKIEDKIKNIEDESEKREDRMTQIIMESLGKIEKKIDGITEKQGALETSVAVLKDKAERRREEFRGD